ncbi:DUF533 domain-containing protein [Falsiroseomonas sp.]|uniref:DUF533 domain-containing protein n=1 Tax=Falsiroseomonas sp. TaxID=2870721 RepID=UPI0035678BA7
MDLNRVLGALLGGAARPPRRRRASPGLGSLLTGRSTEARAARAIGALAAGAITEWMRSSRSQPAPAPASSRTPGPAPRRSPDLPATARRLPEAGRSPWSTAPASPPEPAGPEAADADAEDAEALLMVRAMIAAAKADGAVDAAERSAIAGQLDAAGLSAEERDFVLADFDRPLTPEALAREASDPMLRARLYAAAFAAMGDVSPAERGWLDALARALKLDRQAAAAIEDRLSA